MVFDERRDDYDDAAGRTWVGTRPGRRRVRRRRRRPRQSNSDAMRCSFFWTGWIAIIWTPIVIPIKMDNILWYCRRQWQWIILWLHWHRYRLSDLQRRCVNKQAGKKQGEGKNLNSATHVPRILIFYVIQRILISPNIMVASVWTVEVQILLLPAEFRHFSNPCTEVCVHARCRLDRLSVNSLELSVRRSSGRKTDELLT